MNENIKIQKDTSIILSYSFLYDDKVVTDEYKKYKDSKEEIDKVQNTDIKYENLLNYADRLFTKNKIKRYTINKESFLNLYSGIGFRLKIEEIYILFFENNIAFLNIKLEYNETNLHNLYTINKALTNFMSRSSQSYINISASNPFSMTIDKSSFIQETEKFYKLKTRDSNDREYAKSLLLKMEDGKFYKDDNLNIANTGDSISFKAFNNCEFTRYIFKQFFKDNKKCNFYDPHKDDTKIADYPFDKDYEPEFEHRVGPGEDEKDNIHKENNAALEGSNRHYKYFENQNFISGEGKEKVFDFIHFDTFITSLIVKYVKPNDGVLFYDNFNPIATNYINSYITLSCDSNILDSEVENNFLSFEPLISSKTNKGRKIVQADYFEMYQSQSDMFTIGNSHNIVHIIDNSLDKDVLDSMLDNKKTKHFYIYQLSQLQRASILRIINASILNLDDIVGQTGFFKKVVNSIKSFKMIKKSVDDYTKFLTNINFSIISNSSSMDNSYQFFRKCNEVGKLTDQWGKVSSKLSGSKKVITYILGEFSFAIAIVTILIFFGSDILKYVSLLLG